MEKVHQPKPTPSVPARACAVEPKAGLIEIRSQRGRLGCALAGMKSESALRVSPTNGRAAITSEAKVRHSTTSFSRYLGCHVARSRASRNRLRDSAMNGDLLICFGRVFCSWSRKVLAEI